MKKKHKPKWSNINVHFFIFGFAILTALTTIFMRLDFLLSSSSQTETAAAQSQIVNIRAS